MPVVSKSALVHHSAAEMYQLVCDFEAYPEFLPWCSDSRLISRTDDQICGELEVSRIGIRQRFSTCNQLVENERMDILLRDGPFRKLEGGWRFTPLQENASKVELVLDFEFSSRLIDKAFGRVFSQIANTLVDSFCKRADEVYRG
ncbi:type II toxin-antitoxin system RatA family toxin [Candidatus Endoriftia persephonae]|jgi:ribosome-associated toxin RatA of RatAB toxin-antitoxin module|uniref:Type II toxin-antitoxin system RatA family toxin n=4 Tax=Gammaproteobacteria TaxID=1236 RepID=A0A9J6ZVC3_9GAMM|nr:type II toxin-antitoxin system RatA family toxin [Candidatus Endoriftia persephone]EGV49900.1 putative oligoketide cyclase/lipid transport protein [endosymbiont of Riftia pachyptila (vent Ph05)]EGW55566.1 putative oligoketide cyclase/lipid transport protein [endosymbiont of Tevnia jerichonana (vent Tica)]KRT55522.1 Ribosome association toxin PasT (RatA) of the RatAB toxin-antitoxin module [endosymbiont of Ridgeia piscesae]KRT57935.1 Ribosome association toxin PasT (RatA) of the RatAB toxin-a